MSIIGDDSNVLFDIIPWRPARRFFAGNPDLSLVNLALAGDR